MEPRSPNSNEIEVLNATTLGVRLQDDSLVLVEREDYEFMRSQGWVGRWTARKVTGNNTYPSINHGSLIHPVSRVLLGAKPGEVVRYVGSRLDLRRENLRLHAKGGGPALDHSMRRALPARVVSNGERGVVTQRLERYRERREAAGLL